MINYTWDNFKCDTCKRKTNPDGDHCQLFKVRPVIVCMAHSQRIGTEYYKLIYEYGKLTKDR